MNANIYLLCGAENPTRPIVINFSGSFIWVWKDFRIHTKFKNIFTFVSMSSEVIPEFCPPKTPSRWNNDKLGPGRSV